jgi:dTDP-4-dehydrorhamnose reductase
MYLVVGADAEIGRAVTESLRADGTPVCGTTRRAGAVGPDRLLLDLADLPKHWSPPPGIRAACIAAAVARLAECAADPAAAARINVAGTIALTRHLAERGIYTLFLSTNQVFDGRTPHVAADAPTCPVSVYGGQKAETEVALRRLMREGAPVGILRLSKVVSPGIALLRDWRERLVAGQPIRAFADMTLSPVPVASVVRAIMAMLQSRASRVAQLSGPRDVTYVDAARHVAMLCGADPELVTAGRAADIGLPPGATPAHTTLDSSFLRDAHGIVVPDAIAVVGDACA